MLQELTGLLKCLIHSFLCFSQYLYDTGTLRISATETCLHGHKNFFMLESMIQKLSWSKEPMTSLRHLGTVLGLP